MNNGFLLHLLNELNIHNQHFSTRPKYIKMNETWLDHQIAMGNIFVERSIVKENLPQQLGGIPVKYDDSVNEYEIVYED
jgi:hypothetical protein